MAPDSSIPSPGHGLAASPLLAKLNPAQAEAASTLDGPVLVLAGAGTGKTRVLTTRLANLIEQRRCWPSQVLAVTFTNKAAREMRERVGQLIGSMAEDLWLGTFHALAARILRRHAELVGLRSNFSILDTDDQIRLIKQLMQAEAVDEKRWPARVLLGAIERWKDRGLTPDGVSSSDAGDLAGGRVIGLYRAYQERLQTLNACDFGDLLLHTIKLFQGNPEVLKSWQNKFRYILVDEYQDANVAQYLWLRLLAQAHGNICCVGDDDQSIYGWRGAEVGNILRFEADFPGAKVIRLEQNYRSTGHILGAASGLIARNESRLGKTLWTQADQGDLVTITGAWDGIEEARQVCDTIEAQQRAGRTLGQMAILVRAGFQTREFEERLLTLGIPYRVFGGLRFYERAEIRDAIAYLRLIAQPDDDLACERIINLPRRGLGDSSLQLLHRAARGAGTSLIGAAHALTGTDELKPQARRSLASFLTDLDRWRRMADGLSPAELVGAVLDECGYTAMLKADKSPEAPGRLDNLKELVTAIEEFETLEGFLDHVSLVTERNEDSPTEQVGLMTLHAAKGLEFDVVFLPGWEDGLFPSQRALDDTGVKGLEEERRLAYVGITRARRRSFISYAANRRVHGEWRTALPSRFLNELPPEHIDIVAEAGLARGFGETPAQQQWSWGATRGSAAPRYRGGITIDAQAVVEHRPSKAYQPGARVFHQKFGPGTVTHADGDRLEIEFDKAGAKRVMAGFVEPA